MKKILLILITISFFFVPNFTSANFAVPWNATSTTQGWVFPTKVNGVEQTVVGQNYIGTSSLASNLAGAFNVIYDGAQITAQFNSSNSFGDLNVCQTISCASLQLIGSTFGAGRSSHFEIITPGAVTIWPGSPQAAIFDTTGFFGIGTTTPGTQLSIGDTGVNTINFSATATSTMGSGLNIRTGCFSVNNVCVGGGVSSQWVTSGNNIYYNTGNVGIGTTSPYRALSVYGSSDLGNNALAGSFTGTTTATSTLGGGLSISSGCFQLPSGSCLTQGSTISGGSNLDMTYWTGASTLAATSAPTVDYITATTTTATSTFAGFVNITGTLSTSTVSGNLLISATTTTKDLVLQSQTITGNNNIVNGKITFDNSAKAAVLDTNNAHTYLVGLDGLTGIQNCKIPTGNQTSGEYTASVPLGTTNQVTITAAAGTCTWSLPQNINITASTQFGRQGINEAAVGTQRLNVNGNVLLDNAGRLGIGSSTQGSLLAISGVSGNTIPLVQIATSSATTTAVNIDTNGNLNMLNGTWIADGTSTPDSSLDIAGAYGFRLEGNSSIETASISGAIIGLGCDTSNTTVSIPLASTTALVTTPETYPGAGLTWQSYVLNSTTIQTTVCSDVTVTPTASKYVVKIIR